MGSVRNDAVNFWLVDTSFSWLASQSILNNKKEEASI